MSQLHVTITGHLTADPHLTKYQGNEKGPIFKVTLRVASSRRYLTEDDKGRRVWADTDLLFVDVEAWGEFAKNLRRCLRKGMPVIIVGSLNSSQYTDKEGIKRSRMIVRAHQAGLDLNRYAISSLKLDAAPLDGMELPDLGEVAVDRDFSQDSQADTAADSQAASSGAGAEAPAGTATDGEDAERELVTAGAPADESGVGAQAAAQEEEDTPPF